MTIDSFAAGSENNLTLNDIQKEVYSTAKEKGWHENRDTKAETRMANLMLLVCEIAEVAELVRAGSDSEIQRKISEFYLGMSQRVKNPEWLDALVKIDNEKPARILSYLMLEVTEAAEAAECVIADDFEDRTSEKGKPEGFASERADQIIRILDSNEAMGIDTIKHVLRKNEFNKKRQFKHGGKRV